MKTIEAHELLAADRGVEIVLSTYGFTYAGWFQAAKDLGKRDGQRWTGIALDDSDGRKVTAVVAHDHHVAVTPFPPLAVGDEVVHARSEERGRGTVLGTARVSDGRAERVFKVQWEGEPAPRWHARRNLALASVPAEEVDQ